MTDTASPMEQSSITQLPFRGHRNYLHSASLFAEMESRLKKRGYDDLADIDFQFDVRTANQVRIVDIDPGNPVATFRHSGGALFAVDSGVPITAIEPYDEDGMVSAFQMTDDGITIDLGRVKNNFIDCAVAAFKAIMLKRDPTQKYVFVRMRLQRIPSPRFAIRYNRTLGQFYEGAIELDGRRIGAIYYGVWS